MNKSELINGVAAGAGLDKGDAARAVESVLEQIAGSLSKHESVTLIGFGTFSTSHRSERTGRNPRDGSQMTIPASNVVKFKPGKALKESVN